MKILMLVNWKIQYCNQQPYDKQPPDYFVLGEPYWFYRYFTKKSEVKVIDISSFLWLEKFEKEKIRFYIWQAIKAISQLKKYDLVISHGMQSGVILSLWRRIFKTRAKHIVFDIGAFNSAAEKGIALKFMQFASKSINGVIYHTSNQSKYYKDFYPWILSKSMFIRYGADIDFFNTNNLEISSDRNSYILCVGYAKRDWDTVVEAYGRLNTNIKLRLVGHVEDKYYRQGIEQIPFISIRNLIKQIFNARFCILPLEAFNYSFGQMTLMQQMALEKCVIAAKVPSLIDYMEDGKTVLTYEAKDASDCEIKMRFAIENDEKIKEIGFNARKFLQKYCNEKIMAKEIEQFFNQIMGK